MNLSGDKYDARLLYGSPDKSRPRDKGYTDTQYLLGRVVFKYHRTSTKYFLRKRLEIGVYELSLSNYRLKLDKIEASIKREMNGRKNLTDSVIKVCEGKYTRKYSKIKFKLNLESNGKLKQSTSR